MATRTPRPADSLQRIARDATALADDLQSISLRLIRLHRRIHYRHPEAFEQTLGVLKDVVGADGRVERFAKELQALCDGKGLTGEAWLRRQLKGLGEPGGA